MKQKKAFWVIEYEGNNNNNNNDYNMDSCISHASKDNSS